ncbi:MAG: DNA alkylation repair protein [Desulfosarcinaceae bacterium]|nr:DNA alkylation repair protein [Desulfosarcinaceae bacterium]
MMRAEAMVAHLKGVGDAAVAAHSQRFFKTGAGEYGEGDRFLGIRVPVLRQLARRHKAMALAEVKRLLKSPYHEARLLALLMLVDKYQRGNEARRDEIYTHYLGHTRHINNWDLVDTSAPHIVGRHLLAGEKRILHQLAASDSLWERRIAMIATFTFIRHHQFDTALAIADQLRSDPEDLIHKAVGWMLREVGKRDRDRLKRFLFSRYQEMPRTLLRYAIERFPTPERKAYLAGTI